jgi:hypothetical protein
VVACGAAARTPAPGARSCAKNDCGTRACGSPSMAWGTKAGAADWCRRLQDNDKTLTATGDALDGPSTAPLNFNRPLVGSKNRSHPTGFARFRQIGPAVINF